MKKERLKFEQDTSKTSYAILLKTQMVENLARCGYVFLLTPPEIWDQFDSPDVTI